MNTTTRDLTIAYIENALSEVALLHDAALIGPTLEKFHIERDYARFHGFAPKPGKFNPRAGLKPRPVYTVTDANGRVRHQFTADEPNQLWLTDITEHKTAWMRMSTSAGPRAAI